MICGPATLFATYKTSLVSKRCWRKNSRCVAEFVITLALRFKFALSIPAVCEAKLVLLVSVEKALLRRLMYRFIVDNRGVQIIDKAGGVRWRVGEAGRKSRVTSTCSDDFLAKVYSAAICRIYASLYSIKLGTEFTDAFGCR